MVFVCVASPSSSSIERFIEADAREASAISTNVVLNQIGASVESYARLAIIGRGALRGRSRIAEVVEGWVNIRYRGKFVLAHCISAPILVYYVLLGPMCLKRFTDARRRPRGGWHVTDASAVPTAGYR
jgi:hypothetical protein